MTENTNETHFSLKDWFTKMSQEDQNIIENDIFNTSGVVSINVALENIQDQGIAQGIMNRFRVYLEAKKKGEPVEKLKLEAKELGEFVDREAFK
ncbi:MAG: hypothetical protein WCF92_01355 [bacterium]